MLRTTTVSLAWLFITIAACAEVRVLKFAESPQFRMGTVTSHRIVSPDLGAKRLTLNFSFSQPGNEFAQHTHDDSDDTILIFDGAADLRQGDTRRRFHAGQAAFIPGGQIHGTITANTGTATMISFQTPPDMALYTGARDSSKAGVAAPKGAITPGAVKYVDFAGRNGFFVHPAMGAKRIAVAQWRMQPGEGRMAQVAADAEHVLFVWQGALTLRHQGRNLQAETRDAVFATGPDQFEFVNASGADAMVIQAISPPPAVSGAQFNGRWLMEVPGDPQHRVFWLEVDNTGGLHGTYFGATGGRMARLLDPEIRDGELRFRVERLFEGPKPRLQQAWTTARLRGESLEGVTKIGAQEQRWTGWRAPEIAQEKDDGKWKDEQPVRLFDTALSHWETLRPGRKNEWTFQNGVLRNLSNKAELLVSDRKFRNFRLHLEYRIPKDGNAGFGLRGHYEVQIFDDYGQPPDIHGNGSIYSRIAPSVNASKPAGEWQSIEVTLIGREVSVLLNGVKTIDRKRIDGLCGLASDAHEGQPGPVTIQGDHGPVEYRNLVITPLARPAARSGE